MQLGEFAARCEGIALTSGNDSRDATSEVLEEVSTDDAEMFLRFLLGEKFKDPERTTNVGRSLLFDAAANAFGVGRSELDEAYKSEGKAELAIEVAAEDGGTSQAAFATSQQMGGIYNAIQKLPDADGNKKRVRIMQGLFTNCDTAEEAKWVAFCIIHELSLGVGSGTVKKAMVQSFDVDRDGLDKAYAITQSLPEIVRMLKEGSELPTEATPGIPFAPMLASPKDTEECDNWFAQPKFDGARVLLHSADGEARIFTRNRKEVTDSIPEVTEAMDTSKEFIVDGEAVGFNDMGEVLDLNMTMKRLRREHDVEEMMEHIQIRVFLFDIIKYEGEDFQNKTLGTRLDRLDELIGDISRGEVRPLSEWSSEARGGGVGTGVISTTPFSLDAREMFDRSLELGHEGIIVKDPHSNYLLDQREQTWRKVKTENTLDLRVTGYEFGTGDRAGGLGALELATSDGVSVGFVGTGFTDEEIHSLEPNDVMDRIVEVKAEGPVMQGSIRFPRFERFRDTKDEADSFDRVKEILN